MNVFADFTIRVRKAVESLGLTATDGSALDLTRVLVEPPRDPAHGDLATNAAMVIAKAAGENPRQLALKLVGELAADPDVAETEVAGPGF
ncbi:arginine--tRNA ligase, partial [Prosthecomicrobium hirschii]